MWLMAKINEWMNEWVSEWVSERASEQASERTNEQTNERLLFVWHWTPIRYVTLHFRDRVGAASLRYRNRAEITVLMWEQKPYPVWTDRRTNEERILFVRQYVHLSDMWLSALELGTSSFATLQKSRRNHRSYVRTEALLGMDGRTNEGKNECFSCGSVNTYPICDSLL